MEKAAYYFPLTIVLIEEHFFAFYVPASSLLNLRLENTAEIFKNGEDKTVYLALKDKLSEVKFLFPVKFLQKAFEKERSYDKYSIWVITANSEDVEGIYDGVQFTAKEIAKLIGYAEAVAVND